ncbi:MAG: response regulator [Sediminibacterium sp.]
MLTKIGLVDDHVITRKGIKTLLELNKQYKVVLEASTGKELLKLLKNPENLPDLLIMDLSMPDLDGYATISETAKLYPATKILIFSLYQAEDAVLNGISRGASGYLHKSVDPDLLLVAVNAIMTYGFYFNEQIKKRIQIAKSPKSSTGFHGKQRLTEKELEFIRLASSNLTYKDIAAQMKVQPKTLENYRDSTFQKLGINNRAALTLYAMQNGIVHLL